MEAKKLGEELKKIRKGKGLTLEQLGNKTGFTKGYLSMIENGKLDSIPQPETLGKLADGLEISPTEIMVLAGYFDEEALKTGQQSYAATVILDGIYDLLDKMEQQHPIPLLVETFRNEFNNSLDNNTDLNSLKTKLYRFEGDDDPEPLLGTSIETAILKEQLEVLSRVLEDDYEYKHLKTELEENKELLSYISKDDITYNGYTLSEHDKNRILDMLKIIFPDYQASNSDE